MFDVNFHSMELGGIWVRYKYQIVYINLTFLTDPFLIITKTYFLECIFCHRYYFSDPFINPGDEWVCYLEQNLGATKYVHVYISYSK